MSFDSRTYATDGRSIGSARPPGSPGLNQSAQRGLRPLSTVIGAAMQVLAESDQRDHPMTCTCAMCQLRTAVDYQLVPCALPGCGVQRHEHSRVNTLVGNCHPFYETAKPYIGKRRGRKASR